MHNMYMCCRDTTGNEIKMSTQSWQARTPSESVSNAVDAAIVIAELPRNAISDFTYSTNNSLWLMSATMYLVIKVYSADMLP